MVADDFNGDGRTDLAFADPYNNDVFVLLGNGNGTFVSAPTTTPVAGGPYQLVAGDFTGNGRVDLAVADFFSGTVTILLGNGDGTFQVKQTISLPPLSFPDSIVSGHFTGSGHLDLAVGNGYDGAVEVLIGNGNGTFQNPAVVSLASGSGSSSVLLAAGNFKKNGRTDLAAVVTNVIEQGTTLDVLLPGGNGTFQVVEAMPINVSPVAIVAGDFTSNGIVDLAAADSLQELDGGLDSYSVFLGNGNGTLGAPTPYGLPGTGNSTAIATGDFTGDGQTDLALARAGPNNVQLLLGNGDGLFSDPAADGLARDESPLVADLNGDGTPDVSIIDSSGDILYRQGIAGDPGSFLAPVTVNPDDPSPGIAVIATRRHRACERRRPGRRDFTLRLAQWCLRFDRVACHRRVARTDCRSRPDR